MSLFCTIKSKIIPDVFPTVSYFDNYLCENDPVRVGLYSIEINNADLYNKEIKVQSWLYDKYEIVIYSKESVNIDLLKYSDDITITTKEGYIHSANILESVEATRISPTELRKYVITYYDEYSEAINNYFDQQVLLDRYGSTNMARLRMQASLTGVGYIDTYYDSVSTSGRYTLYTSIIPIIDISETKYEDIELDTTIIKSSQITNQKIIRLKLFLNSTDKNVIKQYLPMITDVTVYYDSLTYTSIERTIPEINEIGAKQFYEVLLDIKYSNTQYEPFAT